MGRNDKKRSHRSSKSSSNHSLSRSRSRSSSIDSIDKSNKKKSKSKSKKSKRSETKEERLERKRQKKLTKLSSYFGYTNSDNPFGDSNLTGQFIWKKKYEGKESKIPTKQQQQEQRLSMIDEIDKVKKRRQQRQEDLEEMERLRAEETRLRDAEQYEGWKEKEEEFHREQEKQRSRIRIHQGREQPIDRLVKNLLLLEESTETLDPYIEMEFQKPYQICQHLNLNELNELENAIYQYQQHDPLEEVHSTLRNKEFWKLMIIVCQSEKEKTLQKEEKYKHSNDRGIHNEINKEVKEMFNDKSTKELIEMEKEIEQTIEKGHALNIEYWEHLLKELKVYYAQARLSEIHSEMLKEHSQKIKKICQERKIDHQAFQREKEKQNQHHHQIKKTKPKGSSYVSKDSNLDTSRQAIQMEEMEKEKGMEDSEDEFGHAEEVQVDTKPSKSILREKFQPRKPRYFNRVKTGYDWNKYNQSHYDHDNPPPKVVQGYKFNIFYPDLIDKTQTPSYRLEKARHDTTNDFCIIRFMAGPPYQDIAFKIVNREWEYSHKRGFKCVYERGILHLYFNFKRSRYRR